MPWVAVTRSCPGNRLRTADKLLPAFVPGCGYLGRPIESGSAANDDCTDGAALYKSGQTDGCLSSEIERPRGKAKVSLNNDARISVRFTQADYLFRGAFYFTGPDIRQFARICTGPPIGAVVVGGGTTLNGRPRYRSRNKCGSNLSAVRNLFTGRTASRQPTASIQSNLACGSSGSKPMTHLHKISMGKRHFSTLQGFLQGTVSTFTVAPVATPLGWRSFEGAVFAQDALS